WLHAARAAPAPGADEIPGLVGDLLSPDERAHKTAEIRLLRAGDSAAAALLAALDDPRATWNRAEGFSLDGSPAERVWQLLWETRPSELGKRVGHHWDDPAWQVFTKAIRARASIGTATLTPWVIELLRNDKHKNASMRRDAVCEGIDTAVKGGWAEPALIAAVLDWARANITGDGGLASAWAIGFLAQQRREEALGLLTSDRLLSADNNRNIHFVLEELTRQNFTLPAVVVRPLVQKSRACTAWPWNCAFGPAIRALARTERDEAVNQAESALLDEESGRSAVKFLHEIHGLPETYQTDPPDGMPLTNEERRVLEHFSNVIGADGQIGNGGLPQYFFNSSGDNWRRDAESFTAIGFPEGAAALEQAARILNKSGASRDRDRRIKEYASVSEGGENELDSLSELFWGAALDAAEYRYMAKHGDLFRRVRAARIAAGIDQADRS
ncbi:MAG TPA: DUF4375 domain-containing protein, partial [Phycisphaerales bacterium]|nr:DUF4375 domain-containing protein [Phycisphaerales bacterium]